MSAGEPKSAWLPVAIALAAVGVGLAVGSLAPMELVAKLMDEDGPVESGTAVVYALAIIAVWTVRRADFGRLAAAAISIVLLACIAREVSLRRHLNVLSDGGCCLGDWTMSVLLLLFLIAAIGLAAYYYRPLLNGLRERRPTAIAIVTIACCLAISQTMDRLPKLMEQIEVLLGPRARIVALSVEETLELAVPILIIGASLQARRPSIKTQVNR